MYVCLFFSIILLILESLSSFQGVVRIPPLYPPLYLNVLAQKYWYRSNRYSCHQDDTRQVNLEGPLRNDNDSAKINDMIGRLRKTQTKQKRSHKTYACTRSIFYP